MDVQTKEQKIIGTILACNTEIKRLQSMLPMQSPLKNLSECRIYHYNMLNLYAEVSGTTFQSLNESDSTINKIIVADNLVPFSSRNNFYAYFNRVQDMLAGFEVNVQHTLNESLTSLMPSAQENKAETGTIESFKYDLKTYIDKLSKIDDVEQIVDDKILRIKLLANRSLFIYGFDIVNSLPLQAEILNSFKKLMTDLISIIFDKSSKDLYFIFNGDMLVYSIKTDKLERCSLLNAKDLNFNGYMKAFKASISQNIVEVFYNVNANTSIKLTDNLYNDVKRTQAIAQLSKQMLVKQSVNILNQK